VTKNVWTRWPSREALSRAGVTRPRRLLAWATRVGALGIAEIAQILFPLAEHVISTHADSPRAASTDELRELAGPAGSEMIAEPTVAKAIERARSLTPHNGVVVITGSIYIVGEAFGILQERVIVKT